MLIRMLKSAACLPLLAGIATSPVAAAPQVLALISTGGPVALQCDATTCRAEIPSLCLQPERPVPERGHAYRLADGQTIDLVGQGQGGTVSVPMNQGVAISASRTHVAVTVTIDRELIDRHGIGSPAIRVDAGVAALPVATAGDASAQSAADIAAAVGSQRAIFTDFVDRDERRMPAVRLITRMINALPDNGDRDPQDIERLWTQVTQKQSVPPAALAQARFDMDVCEFRVANRLSQSFRRCLEAQNDGAMEWLNNELEAKLKSGS